MPDAATRMDVVGGIEELDVRHGPAFVVVGVFDGLHLGHAYLIRQLVRIARRREARPTVITFDHHPDEILVGRAPALLLDPDERLTRLAAADVATTVVQHFDEALRMTGYDAFIRRIAQRVELSGFLMTPDAAFGHERRGTVEAVSSLGTEMGFEVIVVPPFTIADGAVTSTAVRAAIAAGDLAHAERLLGRPVAVVGLATRTAGGAAVAFRLPVALPPAGAYEVAIRALDARSVRGRVAIGGGQVVVDRPVEGPVRIVFG